MADAVTPAAAAASGVLAIPVAAFLGFDAEILAWGLGGIVCVQAFLPQPKDRPLGAIALMAAASMVVAAGATPYVAPLLQDYLSAIKALSKVPIEAHRRAAAVMCGAFAQPGFLLLTSFLRKKAPSVQGANDG